jgi:hypothetical protein
MGSLMSKPNPRLLLAAKRMFDRLEAEERLEADRALFDEMELSARPNVCGCPSCLCSALADVISHTSDPAAAFDIVGQLVESKLRDQAGCKQH